MVALINLFRICYFLSKSVQVVDAVQSVKMTNARGEIKYPIKVVYSSFLDLKLNLFTIFELHLQHLIMSIPEGAFVAFVFHISEHQHS